MSEKLKEIAEEIAETHDLKAMRATLFWAIVGQIINLPGESSTSIVSGVLKNDLDKESPLHHAVKDFLLSLE